MKEPILKIPQIFSSGEKKQNLQTEPSQLLQTNAWRSNSQTQQESRNEETKKTIKFVEPIKFPGKKPEF